MLVALAGAGTGNMSKKSKEDKGLLLKIGIVKSPLLLKAPY